jgi:peptidoglycan hydrolase CwlO-like protein
MKLRIQYLYENSTDNSIWSAILESNGLSDMLNRIEYATLNLDLLCNLI